MKEKLTVVGAAIISDGKVLALRRKHGNPSVIHKFEFVGGKVADGEDPQEALKRECLEELNMKISVGDKLATIEYEYPERTIVLSVYFATALSDFELLEHEEGVWIEPKDIVGDDWAPADTEFLDILKKGQIGFSNVETLAQMQQILDLEGEEAAENGDSIRYDSPNTIEDIKANIKKGYAYTLISLNGEMAGFFVVANAKLFEGFEEGLLLINIYLKKFARGKGIVDKVFSSLPRPLLIALSISNTRTLAICKHCGFRIVKTVLLGGEDDSYIMELE